MNQLCSFFDLKLMWYRLLCGKIAKTLHAFVNLHGICNFLQKLRNSAINLKVSVYPIIRSAKFIQKTLDDFSTVSLENSCTSNLWQKAEF